MFKNEGIKNNNRTVYLDFLRIISCFFVIVNHTESSIFTTINSSKILYLSVFYFYASKTAVPIFIMITGALLLKREIPINILFRKYIFKIINTTILFSFLIYYFEYQNFDFMNFFKIIFKNPIDGSYWYLYMLIGIYLMLPFIKKMIDNLDSKLFLNFFFLWVIFNGIIPILKYSYYLNFLPFLEVPIVSGYIGYLVFGYYLNVNRIYFKFILLATLIVFLFSTFFVTYLTIKNYYEYGNFTYHLDNVNYVFFILSSLSLFILIQNIFKKVTLNPKIEIFISFIAQHTFGVYLIHILVKNNLTNVENFLLTNLGSFFGIIFFQIAIFISSLFVIILIKKIPVIKKLI